MVDTMSATSPSSKQSPLLQRRDTWTTRSQAGKAKWWYVIPVTVLQFWGIAVLIPILPRLKGDFFGGDLITATRAQAFSETLRAVLTALVSSELGKLSDMFGRRPMLFLAVICAMLPIACLTICSNLWVYFIAFGLVGVLGGETSFAINAYIADCSKEADRAKRFGITGAMVAIGFAVAPPLGGQLESLASTWTVITAGLCVEVLALVSILLLPESLPADRRVDHRVTLSWASMVQPIMEFTRKSDSRIRHLIVLRMSRGFTMIGQQTVILFALPELIPSWNDQDNGTLLGLLGVGMILAQGLFLPCLLRFSCKDIALLISSQLATTCASGAFLTLGVYPSKACLFSVLFCSSCFSWFDPIFTKLVATGQEEDLGLVLGGFQSIDALVACVAPFLFSTTFAAGPLYPFALIFLFNVLSLLTVIVVARSFAPAANAGDSSDAVLA